MNNFNSNSHHRRSIRLQGYDYSKEGLYFITMCVQDHKCLFWSVENDEMILNDAGEMADDCWRGIPGHFPNTVLHEFIVMPNHIHGIVEIKNNVDVEPVGAENFLPQKAGCNEFVGAENFLPLQPPPVQNKFQKMIPRSIGSIVKGYKIGVTKWFRNHTNIEMVWQRNYYEHIIRNEKSYQRISEYIINNPKNWKDDKFYRVGP